MPTLNEFQRPTNVEFNMEELRIAAVSAPQWRTRPERTRIRSLSATDPFSLQNAMRLAAHRAQQGRGAWGASNFDTVEGATDSVLLFEYWENQRGRFERMITERRPHILFIGAMTLSFRGAIEMARYAKRALADEVLVVLGGKHCNETIISSTPDVDHLRCSPAQLLEDGEQRLFVDGHPIFDLVCSGEAEELIVQIGEVVAASLRKRKSAADFTSSWAEILGEAKGHWTASRLIHGKRQTLRSRESVRIDLTTLPTAAEVFGVHSKFAIFDATRTGHAYSDMGLGCHFNCFFCSERRDVSGPLRHEHHAASRLLRHFSDISKAVKSTDRTATPSAFVEDSIFLGGSVSVMSEFRDMLQSSQRNRLPVFPFGIQLTVDDVLRAPMQDVLKSLKDVGLSYVAIGIETEVDAIARTMSKNRGKALWTDRVSRSIETLTRLGLSSGVFVLWGLGESQQDRLGQLDHLKALRAEFSGQPSVVSLNLAVQHPLGDARNIPPNNFLDWGTRADSEYLPLMVELFGEASEIYGLLEGPGRTAARKPPSIDELQEVREAFLALGTLRNTEPEYRDAETNADPVAFKQAALSVKSRETDFLS